MDIRKTYMKGVAEALAVVIRNVPHPSTGRKRTHDMLLLWGDTVVICSFDDRHVHILQCIARLDM